MTNIDKSKAVRVLVVFLFGVVVLAFGFNLFGDTIESTSALLYPLTVFGVYIPLAFAVLGALLGLAAYLLEGPLKKRLRVSACVFLAVALSVSLALLGLPGLAQRQLMRRKSAQRQRRNIRLKISFQMKIWF